MIAAAFLLFFGWLYWLAVGLGGGGAKSDEVRSVGVAATQIAAQAEKSLERPVGGSYLVQPTPGAVVDGVIVLEYGSQPEQQVERGGAVMLPDMFAWGSVMYAERGREPEWEPEREGVRVFYFNYWPDAGEDWCLEYVGNRCVSPVTSGGAWRSWVGKGAACPAEWLGSFVNLGDAGVWQCVDTGETARCEAGLCTVLLLQADYVMGVSDAWVSAAAAAN